MSKNLDEEEYYVTTGGRIPVKWTPPEVHIKCIILQNYVLDENVLTILIINVCVLYVSGIVLQEVQSS